MKALLVREFRCWGNVRGQQRALVARPPWPMREMWLLCASKPSLCVKIKNTLSGSTCHIKTLAGFPPFIHTSTGRDAFILLINPLASGRVHAKPRQLDASDRVYHRDGGDREQQTLSGWHRMERSWRTAIYRTVNFPPHAQTPRFTGNIQLKDSFVTASPLKSWTFPLNIFLPLFLFFFFSDTLSALLRTMRKEMAFLRGHKTGVQQVFYAYLSISLAYSYNIDLEHPLVFRGPNSSFFGYSVLEHYHDNTRWWVPRFTGNAVMHRSVYLCSPVHINHQSRYSNEAPFCVLYHHFCRVIVGAPRANSTYSSSAHSPGAVYKCRLHSNPERRCTEMDLGRGQSLHTRETKPQKRSRSERWAFQHLSLFLFFFSSF